MRKSVFPRSPRRSPPAKRRGLGLLGAFGLLGVSLFVVDLSLDYHASGRQMQRWGRVELARLADGVGHRLQQQLDPVESFLQSLRGLAAGSRLDLLDPARANPLFSNVMKAQPGVTSINYGDGEGNGYLLLRVGTEWSNRLKRADEPGRVTWVRLDPEGRPLARISQSDDYDPRVRLWYRVAQNASGVRWTEPYVFRTTRDPGITASILVDAARAGVIGADVMLKDLSSSLLPASGPPGSRAFLLTSGGKVVGASDAEPFRKLLSASFDGHLPQAATLFAPLGDAWATRDPDQASPIFETRSGFATIFRDVHLRGGPDLVLALLVPKSSLLREIRREGQRKALAFLAVLLVASAAFARYYLVPIRRLTRAVRKAGSGDRPTNLPWIHRGDEIGTLTAAFRDAEEALREKDAQHRRLLESTDSVPWEVALPSGEITYMGPQAVRLFGCPLSRWKDTAGWIEAVHPEDRERARKAREVAVETGADQQCVYRMRVGDGRLLWIEEVVTAAETDGGAVRLLGFMRDVTARKEAEDARAVLENQLAAAQKMEAIGTLAGGIAHDFNNILSAILGYTELALLKVPTESKLARDLKKVMGAGQRARELVKQILAFSRKSGQVRKPVRAHLAIGEALQLLRETIPANIPIVSDLREEDDTVLADPTQLHQIVMNLCTNAYHAVRADGGMVSVGLHPVEVSTALASRVPGLKEGPYVNLTVSDTGAGMDPEILSRVFEPFFTTKGPNEGSGMGLAMVHGIVNNHGGAIDLHSRLGEGTRVDVYLPRFRGESEPDAPDDGDAPGGSERILVVDDEPALIEVLRGMLESLGYAVVSASAGKEALERFSEEPGGFDLVITDQSMPGMTGATLAKKLLARRLDLPIVICTGHSESLDEESALELGARAFLNKPVERSVLARTVRAVLGEAGG